MSAILTHTEDHMTNYLLLMIDFGIFSAGNASLEERRYMT